MDKSDPSANLLVCPDPAEEESDVKPIPYPQPWATCRRTDKSLA